MIPEGCTGNCGVRKNEGGKLYALTYAKPCSIAIDPIEKKPLFHFHPGTQTLSVATVGCNLHCDFCQNWEISQAKPDDISAKEVFPEGLVQMCLDQNAQGISYTYTEPTVFYEYAYDAAKLAHEKNLYNVFVSNGMINREPVKKISKYLDAMNMDLKAFNDEFYKKICHGTGIDPIKQTAKNCREFGIHLEITNLIIPGFNDNEQKIKELVKFVKSISTEIPLHFSCFSPQYKMLDTPRTPVEAVQKARDIAIDLGMGYVYVGNVPSGEKGENTYCPKCGELLVERSGFSAEIKNLKGKNCSKCGKEINLVLQK